MYTKKFSGLIRLLLLSAITTALQAQTVQRLGIEDMFELAEQNSKSIRMAGIAQSEAEQAVKVARNDRLPSIDLSLSASYLGDGQMTDRDFSNGFKAPMPHLGNNFAAKASQVIYAGGAVNSGVKMAGLKKEMAGADLEASRQEIRFLLVGNYLELFNLHNQTRVYRQNISQAQRLLAEMKAKQTEGVVLKNDITRYELQLQSFELALTQVENSRVIINNELVTVLGLPQETRIEADTTLVNTLPQLSAETTWQESAAGASPLLTLAKLGTELSEQNEKSIRAERLPSVALFAGDHLDGPIVIEVPPINKNFNYWYAGIGLKFNLASTYKSERKIVQAGLATRKAAENEQLLRENISIGVKAAWVRFAESFTIYETRLKNLELAEQNYDVVNNRYLSELALITDMLDASNSKLDAQLQVANARINILFCFYKLKKASGNL